MPTRCSQGELDLGSSGGRKLVGEVQASSGTT